MCLVRFLKVSKKLLPHTYPKYTHREYPTSPCRGQWPPQIQYKIKLIIFLILLLSSRNKTWVIFDSPLYCILHPKVATFCLIYLLDLPCPLLFSIPTASALVPSALYNFSTLPPTSSSSFKSTIHLLWKHSSEKTALVIQVVCGFSLQTEWNGNSFSDHGLVVSKQGLRWS